MIKILISVIGIFLVLILLASSSWRIRDFVFSKAMGLPIAENDIRIDRALRMKTPDGVLLIADLYRPTLDGAFPTIVMRTPYGRGESTTVAFAEFFARRGYNVISQDTRGAGDSGGEFVPLTNEKKDGAATIEWIKEQTWFNGQIATFGMSYLGYTSNAIAVLNDPSVKAVFTAVAPRGFRNIFYSSGGFNVEAAAGWTVFVDSLKKSNYQSATGSPVAQILRALAGGEKVDVPFDHLPVTGIDVAATGADIDFYQTFVNSADPSADYWSESSLTTEEISAIEAPVFLATMWHDTVMPDVFTDYHDLVAAGKIPRLSVASGPHFDAPSIIRFMRDGKAWFDHTLKDEAPSIPAKSIHLNVLGTGKWIESDVWPIPATAELFYLRPNGVLGTVAPMSEGEATSYVYDPNDPTPAVGGLLLGNTKPVTDNSDLEARDDTITFTAEPFESDTIVVGEITASIYFETSVETSDLFVRVNRVSRFGKTKNITDGVKRVFFESAVGEVMRVDITLAPTVTQFKKGERLRVLIASGAHPYVARNLGIGSTHEQAFMAEGRSATIKIHHSANMPSFIEVPLAEISSLNISKR